MVSFKQAVKVGLFFSDKIPAMIALKPDLPYNFTT